VNDIKSDYTSKDIKSLSEIEHLRENPSMYIGGVETPEHLIEEALDNSLDEALAGFATEVKIIIDTKDNIFTVIDNGRGIPIDNDTAILISTKLFTGSKFKSSKTVYDISAGIHGVGLVCICALSKFFTINIFRDEKEAKYEFVDAKLKKKQIKKSKEKPFSTSITFQPDPTIFESLVPDLDRLRKRLKIASTCLTNCKFILIVDGKEEIISMTDESYFNEICLKDEDSTLFSKIEVNNKSMMFKVIFCYSLSGAITPRFNSAVNLLPVESGGTHITYFGDILKEVLQPIIKKNNIKIQPNDCLYGLRSFVYLYLTQPEFSSQTKERLSNKKSEFDIFTRRLKTELTNLFEGCQDTLLSILKAIEAYRAEQSSKKIKALGTQHKRASTVITKLRDCSSDKGDLFIVEGDSAAGGLIQCRNPRVHAIYPLKGKIPNIINKKDVLHNKEISGLVQALGTSVDKQFDLEKLRYNKIIITVDADEDGKHIGCLLLMVFATLMPDIIKSGKLFLASTPLFAIVEKDIFLPLWTDEEVKKAYETGKRIMRFKGLGELSPNQLKKCVIDEKTRRLIPIEFSKDIKKLMGLFENVEDKRKLLET
jgi:DNA gyrase subunit B